VVTLSWAQTLNGAISRDRGSRTRISSEESLELTHGLRSLHDAILVGIGTVLSDDPELSVRRITGRQPRPIVLDSHLRTPPGCRLMRRGDMKPWIFHSAERGEAAAELAARGAGIFRVERKGAGLDLSEVLGVLGRNGISSLMVEGGAGVLSSFLRQKLAEQAVVTISPAVMIGGVLAFDSHDPAFTFSLEETVWEKRGIDMVLWAKILSRGL
jgi:riboflavin-specific deaminase-like protein